MPLEPEVFAAAGFRSSGRRFHEMRVFSPEIRTQLASDGSSRLDMGLTKVWCTVAGPREPIRRGAKSEQTKGASVDVKISIMASSTVDYRKGGRNDKRITELESAIRKAFESTIHTHLYPSSQISIQLHVLHQDGSLLAALINAATLALVDAGIPMSDYLAACSAGLVVYHAAGDDRAAALLDIDKDEEDQLPYLTVATLGASDKVAVLWGDTNVHISRLETMMACAVDGCGKIREKMDDIVKQHGQRLISQGTVERSAEIDMDMD
ncbi:exoribonuclease family protein [Plectosphaerella plurivora]|uniref:Ribosomal RNA-processing protein 41 n=1 Tax=Plectosphaerella plurivora TaxID=936078 RepID=A0A9P9ACJ7_9PEZI|nr:exoribonuclease family protein [Plectosphaerella plurivora]